MPINLVETSRGNIEGVDYVVMQNSGHIARPSKNGMSCGNPKDRARTKVIVDQFKKADGSCIRFKNLDRLRNYILNKR